MNTLPHPFAHRQRGVVMIFALIALAILFFGVIAIVRSTQTSLLSAGNLSFRRDLVNQSDQAIVAAMNAIGANGFDTTSDSLPGYKASMLPAGAQGIPTVLLNTGVCNGVSANGIGGVTLCYVIDRLCDGPGPASSPHCVQTAGNPAGGTASSSPPLALPSATVYRLSARLSGPRNTQAFFQTTFTSPH